MKYCIRCGRVLNNNAEFCNGCGMRQPFVPPESLENRVPAVAHPPMPAVPCYAPVNAPVNAQVQVSNALVPVYYTPLPRHKKGVMPFLVWSLILVPFFNIIGTPLAVIAAMLCLSADADHADVVRDEKSDINLSKAAILCIIATVVDVATLILLVTKSFVVIKGAQGF